MNTLKYIIFGMLILSLAIGIAAYFMLGQKKFGKAPSGKRLERILKSPHYRKDHFENLSKTPEISEDTSMPEVLFKFIFGKKVEVKPNKKFSFTKTDLKNANPRESFYVWMGHSSYFIQVDGKKILVDPVFSGAASPFPATTRAFAGADVYSAEDMPVIDYLVISHDHWDHLDFETVTKLIPKVKTVVTGLGTGEHLEFWSYNPAQIVELDWGENFYPESGYTFHCETARHFSGRGLTRNKAIWASFVFETPKRKIYLGGDSGYDSHFKNIGEKYRNIELAILENGQYNKDWRYIHMLPEKFPKAASDLNASTIIAVHNSKFALASHNWKEPMRMVTKLTKQQGINLITPKIGEKVFWEQERENEAWWEAY